MQNILSNYEGHEDSFIYKLYREATFDTGAYNALVKEIFENTINDFDPKIEPYLLSGILSKTLLTLVAHFDSNDLYEIIDLDESYYMYIERLAFLIEKYLMGNKEVIFNYEDELGKLKEIN